MTTGVDGLPLLGKCYSKALTIAPLLCLTGFAEARPSSSNVSPTTQHSGGFVETLGSTFGAPGEVIKGGQVG